MERGSVRVRSNRKLASKIVSDVMGEYHGYYAGWAARSCGDGLVAYIDGKPAGAVIYYVAGDGGGSLGVIYYVAVLPQYRGVGLGRILVASAEEVMDGVDVYVATTTESNIASRRLFESMGYRVLSWEALEALAGSRVSEALYLATCAYEDDTVMLKEARAGGLRRLARNGLEAFHNVWDEICLKPYLLRARSRRRLAPLLGRH